MGTTVHCKSYLPGYYPMRDLNEDSSSSSWPLCYGDKAVINGQHCNGFMPRTIIDGYLGYDKDALKQKILEHEAVFKDQVYELHRLYRIQRDMMKEFKRKEVHGLRGSIEPSSSSSLQESQLPSEDAQKWHMEGFPFLNSGYGRRSISGVEILNSPMSCTKGNNTQPARFPFQDGSISKDFEALDSRPLKVRKKLFDLELPADEYIDTEEREKPPEYKVSEIASYAPNGNSKSDPESLIAASASASCLRNSIRLADLNEPIEIEEAMAPSSVDFHGHSSINGETKCINQPDKSNAGYLGVNGETIHTGDGFLINSSVGSKVNERGWLSRIYEAGSSKSNLSSLTQGHQKDKLPMPSHAVQGMLNPIHHPPGIYPTCYGREDLWRERNHHGLESSDRSRDHCNSSHLEPLVASQAPGSYPFFSSSPFSSSWAHSVSSWAKPTSSFSQKITTFESSLNSAAAMDRSLQTSAHSQGPFGGKWLANASSRLNPGLGSELTTLNGFCHGSASGSKELKVHSTNHGFGHFPKGSCHVDSKPARDINLNEVVSKSSANEAVILQDLTIIDGKTKQEDHLSTLPWLKREPPHGNDTANNGRRSEPSGDLSYPRASFNQFCSKSETVQDLNQPFTPKVNLASSDCGIMSKKEMDGTQNVKKILGFPIFEPGVLKNGPSSLVSTSGSVRCPPEGNNVSKERKNRIIDINLECEPDEQIAAEEPTVEKENWIKGASIRAHIDLNSCVSDCEDPSALSDESKTTSVKITLEIDLEAPVLLESEDDSLGNKNEPIQDEILRDAAETILAISSSCPQIHIDDSIFHPSETSLAESLLWFVNAASSCANEIESTSDKQLRVSDGSPKKVFPEEIDDFEAMTLQLQETKEEDYMPLLFVPIVQKMEEDTGNNTLPTRSRRGQSRRGRQRRDFQRDILPGLTTLSRHEVTEDLQTFGGLMRATGHHWNSGLTRRNGGARGRKRAVVETVSTVIPSPVCTPLMQQLNKIEAGLEDRSLTGWGKTTRRPRRQRCPSGKLNNENEALLY